METLHKVFAAVALAGAVSLCAAQAQDEGWDSRNWESDDWDSGSENWNSGGWELHGFAELGYGEFTDNNDAVGRDATLQEFRGRLETSRYFGDLFASVKVDLLSDRVLDDNELALREAYLLYSVGDMDLRAGRQILTWGTGDLVFLNDMFPKDWTSFFNGRDLEYLKAPSDALKITWFNQHLNLDVVWTPEFDPDTYINGERFSYFNPVVADVVAAPPVFKGQRPGSSLGDGEFALRLYKNVGAYELALYGYRGYFKQPRGADPASGRPYFPRLNVYGASARGTLAGGIANLEFAWRDSREDSDGDDPRVANSEYRFLAGYERELITNLTLGLQYYLEWTADYDRLIAASAAPRFEQSERRHTLTARLTYRMLNDKLKWSLFAFHSPDENDTLAMPQVEYRHSDTLSFAAGFNIFDAERPYTFLGKFEQDSNVYVRMRYSF